MRNRTIPFARSLFLHYSIDNNQRLECEVASAPVIEEDDTQAAPEPDAIVSVRPVTVPRCAAMEVEQRL